MTKNLNRLLVIFFVLVVLLWWSGAYEPFFYKNTYAEYFRNVVLAFVSIAIRIPAGLEINRNWQNIQDDNKKKQLLNSLRLVFQKNQEYLDQVFIQMLIELRNVPSFNLDLITLDATSHIRHELLSDQDLLKVIDKAHFELAHVDRRLALAQQLVITHPDISCDPLQATSHIKNEMQRFEETAGLYNKYFGDDKDTTFNPIDKVVFDLKVGTLNLAVGLTDKDKDKENYKLSHRQENAYDCCQKAIDAIEKELGIKNKQ